MVEIQSKTFQSWPSFVYDNLKDFPVILELLGSIRNLDLLEIREFPSTMQFVINRKLIERCRKACLSDIPDAIWVIYLEQSCLVVWSTRTTEAALNLHGFGQSRKYFYAALGTSHTEVEEYLSKLLNFLLEFRITEHALLSPT